MSNSSNMMLKVDIANVLKVRKCGYEWALQTSDIKRDSTLFSPMFYDDSSPSGSPLTWRLRLLSETNFTNEYCIVSLEAFEVPGSHHGLIGGHMKLSVTVPSKVLKHFTRDFCINDTNSRKDVTVYRSAEFRCDYQQFGGMTLTCSISFYNLSDIKSLIASNQQVTAPLVASASVAGERFPAMYLSEKYSDVTLCVNGNSYAAHKVILAAHSSVFEAMFDNDMKERSQNRVEVKDIDEPVFLEALRFMYTGLVENLDELAYDLLLVSDRYDIKGLKTLCGSALCNKLSVETIMKTLLMADSCNAYDLRVEAIKFVKMNSNDVKNAMSPEEKEEMKRRPNLIIDLLDLFMEKLPIPSPPSQTT